MKHAPGFLKLVNDAKTRIREVTVEDVKAMFDRGDRFELIDTREDNEFARGHLPSARHLSKGIIERDIEAAVPNRRTRIVLYCGGGFRSALAADNLQRMGYTNVVSMDGGWREWTDRLFPIER
jgi:rhodanese-related sulfurtransferase